jgi:hypothetical protein
LSFVLLTMAVRFISAPEVAMFLLLNTAIDPIWVWIAGFNSPPMYTVYCGIVVVVALLVNRSVHYDVHEFSTSYSIHNFVQWVFENLVPLLHPPLPRSYLALLELPENKYTVLEDAESTTDILDDHELDKRDKDTAKLL